MVRQTAESAAGPSQPTAASRLSIVAGATFLGLSAIMSLLLVMERLGGLSLPGCGESSPCAQVANSPWARRTLALACSSWATALARSAAYSESSIVARIVPASTADP